MIVNSKEERPTNYEDSLETTSETSIVHLPIRGTYVVKVGNPGGMTVCVRVWG